jgi:hypothetical protein
MLPATAKRRRPWKQCWKYRFKIVNIQQGNCSAVVEYLISNVKVGGSRPTCAQRFFRTPLENSGGTEKSAENSGQHARIYFCYMYELSQRHPVWVAEINVTACNSVHWVVTEPALWFTKLLPPPPPLCMAALPFVCLNYFKKQEGNKLF